MSIRFAFTALLFLPLAFPIAAAAEDPPTADIKPGDTAADPAIQELIKQLDAKKKEDRDAASAKLKEMGAAAIPALAEGAIAGKREATIRAIDILKAHLQGGDPAAHQAAQDAFARIAVSKAPVAVKRAKDVLQGIIQQQGPNGQFGGIGGPNGGFGGGFGGGIGGGGVGGFGQFGGGGGAGTGEGQDFQIQLFDNNVNPPKKYMMKGKKKVRDIEAEEGGRKIKIHNNPDQGIQIEITEPKDGKEATRKVEAKDAADLKEKDAAAHKDFERYSKVPDGFKFGPLPGGGFQGGAVPFGPGIPAIPGLPAIPGIPGGFPAVPGVPGEDVSPAAQREALEKHVKELEGQIEMLRKNSDIPRPTKQTQIEVMQQTIRTMRAKIKELEKAQKVDKAEKP